VPWDVIMKTSRDYVARDYDLGPHVPAPCPHASVNLTLLRRAGRTVALAG
jgi:hypothetical protein